MNDRFEGVVKQLLDLGIFLPQAIEPLEKGMIQGALDRNNGNQCAAARVLGIHRNTLSKRLEQYQNGASSNGHARRQVAPRRKRRA